MILAGFLILMAGCTILSRAAASILVAQVIVEKPGSGKLSFSYGGNGTVVPCQEKVTFLWPGQQVEWAAEAGSTVKAGECLIQFRMEYLQQAIQSKQAELTQLEIQAQQQQISARGTARVRSAERAKQTLAEAQVRLQEAQQKEAQAQEEYDWSEDSTDFPQDNENDHMADISARRQELQSALQQAQADVEAARQALTQAQTDYDFALKEDAAGAYCLILTEEKTMLGTVQTAKKVPVTVLEKDGQKAAITSALKETDQVIASSEKYVEEGDRVRIKE